MNTSITDRPIATRLLNRGLGQHVTRTGVVGIYVPWPSFTSGLEA